jgi:hypothetical protein
MSLVEWLRNTLLHFIPNLDIEICGFPTPNKLTNDLLNGCVYQIPYDSDKNFGPCNNNGHNAHWFVLV